MSTIQKAIEAYKAEDWDEYTRLLHLLDEDGRFCVYAHTINDYPGADDDYDSTFFTLSKGNA